MVELDTYLDIYDIEKGENSGYRVNTDPYSQKRGGEGLILDGISPDGKDVIIKAHTYKIDQNDNDGEMVNTQKTLEFFRISREANFFKGLTHPNIIGVHRHMMALFKNPDGSFHDLRVQGIMIMDHLGRSVQDLHNAVKPQFLFDDSHPLSLQEGIDFTKGVCSAVDYLLSQGKFHGDIKPQNILIAPKGPVLIDGGLAKSVFLDRGSDRYRAYVTGTPGYIAPELLYGDEVLEPNDSTEIWSVGATVFYALTGRRPFGHYEVDPAKVITETVMNKIDQPGLKMLPEPVAQVIKKSLSPYPPDRFQTAMELSDCLEEAVMQSYS